MRGEGAPAAAARRRRSTSAAGSSKPWTGGDNVNLAVGQGDLQATPLQVAVAYAALANGGTIVRPHLGKAIEDANGFPLQEIRPKPRARSSSAARDRAAVLDGLRARGAGGGRHVGRRLQGLADERYPVYGKTGTAERAPNPDQAWYACFVNDPKRPIVVVVTVEKGGFGAATAAPAARHDPLRVVRREGPRQFHAGSSATR